MIGSFLNVVIWRVPRHESIVSPGSHCPSCDTPIAPWDNVPVLSWLLLRGRCRHCGERISARYPLVELACAATWAGMALRFGASWELPAYLVFTAGLLALALIDLDTFLLPNRIVYPLTAVLLALLAIPALVDGEGDAYLRALLGGAAAFAFFFVVHLVSPRGMGFGDVKLSFSLGVALGWISGGLVFLGLFFGFLLGSVIGVALIALGSHDRKAHIPFGPFLVAGTLIGVLVGQPLVDLWLGT
jgi:leader peptidase (prepilin peptidase)/N-methyltransferase